MPRVLIVEDDDDIREALAELLSDEGFEVAGARDGDRALEMMTEAVPNVVLLDLSMPNMDGWELRDAMKRSEPLAEVPVIVITAAHASVRASIAADEIITKPFMIEELIEAIRRLCEDRHSPAA